MRLRISTIALTLIILYCTGCKKVYDYIEKNPSQTCDACKISMLKVMLNQNTIIYDLIYDKKGNLLTVAARPDPNKFLSYINQHFRYDKNNRLTDYIHAYDTSGAVLLWNHYLYTSSPTLIVDSIFGHAGNASDPHPPYGAQQSAVLDIKLDQLGRVINWAGIYDYVYDNKGNLVAPAYTVYDNKINPYRTNKVWQFVTFDASANNAQNDASNQANNPKILSYNSYGLPTKYARTNGIPVLFTIITFDTLEIKYDCDLSGIKY